MQVLEEDVFEIENRLIMRKLLIITAGSSASIHLLKGIVMRNPEIILENEFMIIETSKDMYDTAIKTLAAAYHVAWKRVKKRDMSDVGKGFPYPLFMKKLKENSVLLAMYGGATTPELGLRHYNERRNSLLSKIENIVLDNDCYGVVVIGCSGKGTGTLITPALISDLCTASVPHPLGFISLPFRFRMTDVNNAKKTIEYIVNNSVPCFLIDYEHALPMYLYLSGDKNIRPTVSAVYSCVVNGIANVLGTLIEALNYGQFCSPPMDWSDMLPLLSMKGCVGTLTYSHRNREEDFIKMWREDLSRLILMRTRTKPPSTNVVSIIRSGAGVPLELTESLSEYYSKAFNSRRHEMYVLEHGEGYTIASLIYGFDPQNIEPPMEYKKLGFFERFKKGLF